MEVNLHVPPSLGHRNNTRMQRIRILHSGQSAADLHEVHSRFQHKRGESPVI